MAARWIASTRIGATGFLTRNPPIRLKRPPLARRIVDALIHIGHHFSYSVVPARHGELFCDPRSTSVDSNPGWLRESHKRFVGSGPGGLPHNRSRPYPASVCNLNVARVSRSGERPARPRVRSPSRSGRTHEPVAQASRRLLGWPKPTSSTSSDVTRPARRRSARCRSRRSRRVTTVTEIVLRASRPRRPEK